MKTKTQLLTNVEMKENNLRL